MTDIYQVSNYTPCQIGLVKGEDGRDGIDGINGVDGKSGKDGKDGLRGLSGSDGKSNYQLALGAGFVGSVDDYLLSMKGDKGLKGDVGADAAIDSMTVATGAAGTNASVVTGGTPIARTFALTIPRGDKGEVGTSATITSVTATTGSAGSAASVSMGGTPTARTFNLTIPRGDKGEKGDTGELPNFYTTTTLDTPNVNIAADGTLKRSNDPSNAASRKVGTAVGSLVERGADGYPTKNNAIGVGQTWIDLTAFRSLSVTYTNTTGRPIVVVVVAMGQVANDTQFLRFKVAGVDVFAGADNNFSATGAPTGMIIVPSGATYQADVVRLAGSAVNNGALRYWQELR